MMIMEAITVMISWHYNTMKMRNSKSEHVEKKQTMKALKKSLNWKEQ